MLSITSRHLLLLLPCAVALEACLFAQPKSPTPREGEGAPVTFCKDAACTSTSLDYRAGEAIHMKLPPSDSAQEIAQRTHRWIMGVSVRVDDQPARTLPIEIAKKPVSPTADVIPLVCDTGSDSSCVGTRDVAKFLAKLGPGDHRVHFSFAVEPDEWQTTHASIGSGDLTLHVGRPNGYASAAESADRAQFERTVMPKPAFVDVQLESEAKALVVDEGIKDVRRVVFTRPWTVTRHPYSGLPISRETHVSFATGPEKNDGVCRVNFFAVKQVHDGDRFGPLRILYRAETFPLACKNIDERSASRDQASRSSCPG